MARTTSDEVKSIISTTLDTGVINQYIATAGLLVDSYLSTTTLSDTVLTEIEKWWTAHLISTTTQRQVTQEKLGDAAVTYAGTYGAGLSSTSYGQMVLMLDSSGTLSRAGKQVISINAIKQNDD